MAHKINLGGGNSYIDDGRIGNNGEIVVFINGLENSENDAWASAVKTSQVLSDTPVGCFYNSSGLIERTFERLGRKEDVQRYKDDKTILKDFITDKMEPNQHAQIKMAFFVHSHGARLLKDVLLPLGDEYKSRIRVFSFGGEAFIPKEFASKVHNFVITEDRIAATAHKSDISVEDGSPIRGFMAEGSTEEEAIIQWINQKSMALPSQDPRKLAQKVRQSYQEFSNKYDVLYKQSKITGMFDPHGYGVYLGVFQDSIRELFFAQ